MIPNDPQDLPSVDLSILVPALNEGPTLPTLIDEIRASMARLEGVTYEVIVIDDGSTDASWETIVELAASWPVVRGQRMRRNFGKAAALSVGLGEARGTIVMTMDADLQDDPDEIPRFLEALDGDADLVSGWKRTRNDPISKRLPSKFFNWTTNKATGLELHDHNCGFKAARREVYDAIPLYGELHRYVPAMAHALGFRVQELPVNHRPRTQGSSKYGLERYLRGMLDLITVVTLTRYGRRPGHLFGGIGVVIGLIGAAILLYLTGVWVFTDHPIGGRPLLTLGVLLEVVAVQLISLGVLSELLLSQSNPRPPTTFVIDRVGPPC